MRTIWQSLAWKEWHEHKWKLVSIVAIMWGVTAPVLLSAGDEAFDAAFITLIYVIMPLAMFIGAGDTASERVRGTLPFLQSLPVPMWKSACWKLVFGLATCVIPIVLTLLLIGAGYALLPTQGTELGNALKRSRNEVPLIVPFGNLLVQWCLSAGLLASIAGTSLYLWTTAIGTNRKDEVRAGAAALLVIVGWWTVVGFAIGGIDQKWLRMDGAPLASAVLGASPTGLPLALVSNAEPNTPVQVSIVGATIIGIVVHSVLASWFIVRFGRGEKSENYSRKTTGQCAAASDWIGPPRRYPLTAIMWKQFRESTPIVLAGLTGIACFFIGNVITNSGFYSDNAPRAVGLLTQLTVAIGFIVALIVGIGVFDRDLGPHLNEFWRSRPIHPDLWFWTKFLTGLGLLSAALYLPLVAGKFWSSAEAPIEVFGPAARMMLCIHVAIYASAMAMICLIRQPVYAAILGTGTLLIGVSLVMYFFGVEWLRLETNVFVIELATALLATLLAWLAVRGDWGWKSRY